jgi:hypothetical protein
MNRAFDQVPAMAIRRQSHVSSCTPRVRKAPAAAEKWRKTVEISGRRRECPHARCSLEPGVDRVSKFPLCSEDSASRAAGGQGFQRIAEKKRHFAYFYGHPVPAIPPRLPPNYFLGSLEPSRSAPTEAD